MLFVILCVQGSEPPRAEHHLPFPLQRDLKINASLPQESAWEAKFITWIWYIRLGTAIIIYLKIFFCKGEYEMQACKSKTIFRSVFV